MDTHSTDALVGYLNHWEAAHLSCEPAQRAAAERGIRAAYAAAGFPAPSIVWCRGPIEIAQELAAAKLPDAIGRNVKTDVFDDVKRRVETLVEVFWREALAAAAELPKTNSIDRWRWHVHIRYHRSGQHSSPVSNAEKHRSCADFHRCSLATADTSNTGARSTRD